MTDDQPTTPRPLPGGVFPRNWHPDRPLIAVRHRMGPSVYFGPFPDIETLGAWCDQHGIAVSIIELTDPESDPTTWWD